MENPKRESIISYDIAALNIKQLKLSTEVRDLERNKTASTDKLEHSDRLLNDMQAEIQILSRECALLESTSQESTRNLERLRVKDGKQRELKEVDKKLMESLRTISSKRQSLIPIQSKSIKDLKKDTGSVLAVHSFKLLLLKTLKDGDIESFDREKALECSIRILSTTTFQDLKSFACDYWGIDPDFYSLRAYNFALIEHIDIPVIKFALDQKMRPELWMIISNIDAEKALTLPNDYFIDENSKNQFLRNDSKRLTGVDSDGRIANMKHFLNTFEGIQKFIPNESLVDVGFESRRLISWNLNFLSLIFSAMILIFTILGHYYMGDFENRYWISYQFKQRFNNQYKICRAMQLENIESLTDIQQFLVRSVGEVFFDIDNNKASTIPVGTLKVRFLKTISRECATGSFQLNNAVCFEDIYNENTRMQFNSPLQTFYTAGENGIDTIIIGKFSEYDGSGYTWDFSLTEKEKFTSVFSTNSLYDKSLRAVIVNYSMYLPNYDYWIFTEIVIEKSTLGPAYAAPLLPKVFRPNLFNRYYQYLLAIFAIRALLSLYFIAYYLYNAYNEWKATKSLQIFKSYLLFFDTLMTLLFFIVFGLAFSLESDEKKLLHSNVYYDFSALANNYELTLIINAWSCLFLIIRFLISLTINRELFLMTSAISTAGLKIVYLIIMILPVFISYAFMAWTIWGPYYTSYHTYGYTFIQNIIFSLGISNSFLLVKLNLFWSIIFYWSYMIFIIFILTCSFMGLYIDAFLKLRANLGFTDDVKVWSMIDYFLWTLACFTNGNSIREKLKKCKKRFEKDQTVDFSEENLLVEDSSQENSERSEKQ